MVVQIYLQHIHATTLLLAGVPVHVVAAHLGHADPAIILQVYRPCDPGDQSLGGGHLHKDRRRLGREPC
ncbi:hypothetical protein [Sinosporangium siamense]|uniref:Tyr recombinase domain-containing protein n=1 Tax=Sinosporangium siamense TaxID=1367973 RepID=A0A919RNK6_9ACTN|nr:hypothetical protein [Sinosporangium siamense]GII95759.1 hypothetical protein Ssi02_59900 [Sinosporangium siamense]